MKAPLYYISSIRFPSEKAHALYIAKSMESYALQGHSATVVVPRRVGRASASSTSLYGLKTSVPVVWLWNIDLFPFPVPRRLAHYVSLVSFLISVAWYVRMNVSPNAVIFSNEVSVAAVLPRTFRFVLEIHDYPERFQSIVSYAFRRASLVLSNNAWKVHRLLQDFPISPHAILVSPNGVDGAAFDIPLSQAEARAELSLAPTERMVVYTGHLYEWKGADILAHAAQEPCMQDVHVYFVGGTAQDVQQFKGIHQRPTVHVVGHRPHSEMPLWMRAADVVVLPNTGTVDVSSHYTSPMKLFEYMASGTPIVASDVPSIREIVSNHEAFFVPPDNPRMLAQKICSVLSDTKNAVEKGKAAQQKVSEYSWTSRAERILGALATNRKE